MDMKIRSVLTCVCITVLLLLQAVTVWANEHYSIVTVRLFATRTDTVVDEVWRNDENYWRLERRSDRWDNGLVAVSDGKRVLLTLPGVPKPLSVSLSAIRFMVDPSVMSLKKVPLPQDATGEESVMGANAILYRSRVGSSEVKLWVDKQTKMPLREERLDKHGRPTMVLVRHELPVAPEDPARFAMVANTPIRQISEWRAIAINHWVSERLQTPVKLTDLLPRNMRMESAEVLAGNNGQTIVVRLARGAVLVSLFLAPAVGDPPTERRLFDRGIPVQAKRLGKYDVTIVGELSAAEAEKLFQHLEEQLKGAS